MYIYIYTHRCTHISITIGTPMNSPDFYSKGPHAVPTVCRELHQVKREAVHLGTKRFSEGALGSIFSEYYRYIIQYVYIDPVFVLHIQATLNFKLFFLYIHIYIYKLYILYLYI